MSLAKFALRELKIASLRGLYYCTRGQAGKAGPILRMGPVSGGCP